MGVILYSMAVRGKIVGLLQTFTNLVFRVMVDQYVRVIQYRDETVAYEKPLRLL